MVKPDLCEPQGFIYTIAQSGSRWATTESVSVEALYAYTSAVAGYLLLLESPKEVGYSVRCIKD